MNGETGRYPPARGLPLTTKEAVIWAAVFVVGIGLIYIGQSAWGRFLWFTWHGGDIVQAFEDEMTLFGVWAFWELFVAFPVGLLLCGLAGYHTAHRLRGMI